MNIQLGRGGKVHYAGEPDGYMPAPKCGGNRAVEGYRAVKAEVDCKNCLKIMAAEAAAQEAPEVEAPTEDKGETVTVTEVPADTEYDAAFERGRSLGKDHAEAHDYAAEVVRNARIRAEQATEKLQYRTMHPVTGKRVRIPSPKPAKWAAWENGNLFGLADVETVAEAISSLPKGREFNVTALFPISPRDAAQSGIIAPDVPVSAGTATTEENEMPPRKRAAAKPAKTAEVAPEAPEDTAPADAAPIEGDTPAEDTADAIQRAKDIIAQVLAAAEVGESADPNRIKELAESAETIIGELPMEHRTGLRAALEEAKRGESYTAEGHGKDGKKKTASKAVAKKTAAAAATKETQDYKQAIPDAEKVVADVAAAYAKGVEFERENSNAARSIAEKVLAARLFLSDKDGHPDYNGKSNAAKVLSGVVYAAAGSGFERTEENEDALDRLVKSVQNLRNDVLVKYVRNIGKEDAHRFFPKAFAADPEADPTEAIQKFYKIPERSTFEIQAEKRRLERAQRKALAAGKEKEAKELGEAIKTVGKTEAEGGEGEGEAAAAPKTAAEKRRAKHLAAIEAATEKFADLEKEIEKIDAEEAAELVAKLEAFNGMSATLTAMLKGKTA
jgi:hypothetical protein